MRKVNFAYSKSRLCIFAAISTIFGIIVFFISDLVTGGHHLVLCIITAFLGNLILFSLLAATMYSSLLKKTSGATDSPSPHKQQVGTQSKENQPLSIIMADLDHFKDISNTYGNIVGDHIMAIFAQSVLNCIRQIDIVAQYSENELIIILPDTDIETARAIAEKMRTEVAKAYVPPIDGVVVSSINCSVDVSSYPTLNKRVHGMVNSGITVQENSFSVPR